ncbi:MAG: carboxypeptidase regulatory-like domain-containing protein [Acidobacteria bacterium]|nr:carboxypeptidase regulatory-like domain-containing protein [Acidobacteriota bacterium]
MNSLTAPFTSSFYRNLSAAINGKRLMLFFCLLVFASSSARAQDPVVVTQAPEVKEARASGVSTGAITGYVVSEDGRPLADAAIYLNKAYARAPGPPLTATTDSQGRFRAANLESGLYSVSARLPGFTTAEVVTDVNDFKYYRLGDSVNLTLVKGGVITGTVRDANGDPVVAVSVRAVRVRDGAGRASANRSYGFSPERMTDDRGVYRIYGLSPGTYVVSTGGGQRNFGTVNAYEGDAPTFFPSSTRDTAAEVPVRGGEEATGIDIRYRGERGHTISGTVSGLLDTNMNSGVPILLRPASGGGYEATSFVMPGTKPGFSFSGVSDGEYEVMAQQWGGTSDSAASPPRRITVKGADVTGIELALAPLASIAGRVQLEAPPKEKCEDNRGGTLMETLVNARRDEKNQPGNASRTPFFNASGGIPIDQGEFLIRNLIAGSYRLAVRLPNEAWYVRSIISPKTATPQPDAPAKAAQTKSGTNASPPAVASVITLKTGERATSISIQVAQDAAGLRGRVVAATEAAEIVSLPANLKVYLVPAARERAEDVLRYDETSIGSDGAFALANLAPGRYWLIARPTPESESPDSAPRSLFWDADSRAKLRREAEAANIAIELQPCQRMSDYLLPYATAK